MGTKILATLMIFLWAGGVCAQETKCTLKLAELPDAPELFGFRMGMTTDQLKARVPRVALTRADEFGVMKTSISPDFDPQMDKASLSGVRTVSFDFLDGNLTSLWLGYDGTFKWHTVPDFISGISLLLHLPEEGWEPWKSRGQQLNCADFQMTVSLVAEGPSYRIVNKPAEQIIAARRLAREEQEGEPTHASEPSEIVGDAKAKLYYLERCQPGNQIKPENRISFETREAAEKAGYKLAKACQ